MSVIVCVGAHGHDVPRVEFQKLFDFMFSVIVCSVIDHRGTSNVPLIFFLPYFDTRCDILLGTRKVDIYFTRLSYNNHNFRLILLKMEHHLPI